MSDTTLRLLERAARVDPSACDARARHMAARLRAGEVDPDRVRLAAYFGDTAARTVLGCDPPPVHLETWALGLAAWGQEPCVRVAVAAARVALPAYERTFVLSTLCRDLLRVADEWLASGGRSPAPEILERPDRGGREAFAAASAAMRVAQAIRAEPADLRLRQRRLFKTKPEIAARFAFLAVSDARSAVGHERVLRAVLSEGSSWAHGASS